MLAAPKPNSLETKSQPPASQAARTSLFEHLQNKAGSAPALPDFPREKLILWTNQRQKAVADDEKSRYLFVWEQLLVAQKLLVESDNTIRSQGLLVASETANYAAAALPQDTVLLARLYEGFLLPYVSLAHVEKWRDPSRQRLIEAASNAFAHAGETAKQQKMQEWLLSLKQAATSTASSGESVVQLDQNTLDWARGTLAVLLSQSPQAPASDLQRALKLLQAISSPDMSGFKHIETSVQARLNQPVNKPTDN